VLTGDVVHDLALALGDSRRRLARALRRGIGVRVGCRAQACDVAVRLTVTRRVARRLGLRTTTLARATADDIRAAETVRLRFTRAVARRLRRARPRSVRTTVIALAGPETKRAALTLTRASR
jgi:hypothetical protein